MFYTDAYNTVIAYVALHGQRGRRLRPHAGTGEVQAQVILLAAITCAVLGGFAWGWVVDRIGPKRTLTLVLWLWLGTFAFASSIGAFQLPIACMYVVASMAGIALGGTMAADRPLMLRLTPPDRVGEFYGLYGMVGRFSAVSGPILWSAATYFAVERGGLPPLTGQAIAIATLLVMVISATSSFAGRDEPRDWAALGAGSDDQASEFFGAERDHRLSVSFAPERLA